MEESNKKVYWKGLEQLTNSQDFVKNANKEFAEPGPEEDLGHSRRDFLKMMGFGVSAVALAACEAPIRKAIPYVNKPVDVIVGEPDVPIVPEFIFTAAAVQLPEIVLLPEVLKVSVFSVAEPQVRT